MTEFRISRLGFWFAILVSQFQSASTPLIVGNTDPSPHIFSAFARTSSFHFKVYSLAQSASDFE